ncbi:MAG: PAS-domain containing protein [Rhodospirillaceae bacterium]|nr:PAS-domain containing protein [Rhodospirillaceae bacterium]
MAVRAVIRTPPVSEPSALDLLDALEAPAALLDDRRHVIAVNPAARIAGDQPVPGLAFVPGRSWAELCKNSGAVGPMAADLEGLVAGLDPRATGSAVDYAVRVAGRLKAFRITARILPGGSNHVLVVQTDSTRFEAVEQRLREVERRQADLAELTADWLWTTDEDLRFVELAAPSDPFWRRVQPKLIGQCCVDLFEDAVETIARHRPFRDVIASITVDGTVHRLRFNGKPIFSTDGIFRGYLGIAADVTRSYEAERARDAAQARLREIAELSSDWYWESDAEFRFTDMSDTRTKVVRLERDQTLGRRRIDMLDRNMTDPEALARHIDDLENHRSFRDFVYGSYVAGKPRYLKVSGKPRFAADGSFLGHLGTATDVTAEVTAEKRREAAEQWLKAAIEQMPSGIAIWDAADRLVVCNEEYWPSNVSRRPAIGRTFEELVRELRTHGKARIDSDAREAMIQERVRQHRNPPLSIEVALANGDVRQVDERRLSDGSMITVTTDISRLKRREHQLSEQRALLQTTLDHVSDGILAVDEDWRIVSVNDTFVGLLGMPKDVARIGAHLSAVIEWLGSRGDYGAERANVNAARVIEEMGSRQRWYDERTTPDGRQISWRVREMQGGGRIIAVADVSEQRQAEQRREQLRSTMAQAQQLEAISRLAGGLAHDLNNMLLPVMTLTELAMDELPEGSPARGDLERVIGAAEHARGLVQRLLTFSRTVPQAGGETMLDPMTRAAAELIKATAKPDLTVTLKLNVGGIAIPLGKTEIQQIVMNLGLNAAQAIGDRRGTLTIETALIEADDDLLRANPSLDSARRYARLTVSDDGPGIPADVLPRIFEPFFTTKPVGQGTGLGLAVVHGLVNQVGGAIEVSSENGARFDILLPIIERPLNAPEIPSGTHPAD